MQGIKGQAPVFPVRDVYPSMLLSPQQVSTLTEYIVDEVTKTRLSKVRAEDAQVLFNKRHIFCCSCLFLNDAGICSSTLSNAS